MLELIPLKASSLLISRKAKFNTLNLMLNLLNEALAACHDFLNNKYTAFDAQVGETSCQIRAYKICQLARNPHFQVEVQGFIPHLLEYKHNLLHYINKFEAFMLMAVSYNKELDRKENKENFFNNIQPDLFLTHDLLFIILAHFLNEYCSLDKDAIPNGINYNSIKTTFNIGSAPARNLANYYQSELSKLSCAFILEQSTYIPKVYAKNDFIISLLLRIGDRKRHALPYYYVTKVLLTATNTLSIPVIFSFYYKEHHQLKQKVLFFKKDCVKKEFILQSFPNEVDQQAPAIIFRGEMFNSEALQFEQFKHNILQVGIEKIILLNAASHPQYAGENLSAYVKDPYKGLTPVDLEPKKILNFYREELYQSQLEAEAFGCSRHNPYLFYIKHIFCDSFYNECINLSLGDMLCPNSLPQPLLHIDIQETF